MLPIPMQYAPENTLKMVTHFLFIYFILLNSGSKGVDICYDINSENLDLVSKTEFKALFTSTASIRPFEDISIVEVVEDDVLLWESEKEDEVCSFIVIFKFEELLTLLCVKITSPDREYKLHFIKENGIWEMLENEDFRDILADMRSKIPTENHILLDIKNPDEEKFTVARRNTGGADFVTFTTNHPYHTIKIVDNKLVIWRGTYNQDCCIDCAVYLKNEDFELLQAFLCSDDNVGFRFFRKVEDKWTVMEDDEFYSNLKTLDIEEDERLLRECQEKACKEHLLGP